MQIKIVNKKSSMVLPRKVREQDASYIDTCGQVSIDMGADEVIVIKTKGNNDIEIKVIKHDDGCLGIYMNGTQID